MDKLKNKKIVNYLNDQSSFENIPAMNLSNSAKLKKILVDEIDTNNLAGWQLKIVEFHNTLFRSLRSLFLNSSNQSQGINQFKFKYKEFIKKINPSNDNIISDKYSRIFLDVTFTVNQSSMTGIPRVVTEIAREGIRNGVILVILYNGIAYKFNPAADIFESVTFGREDIFLHFDAGWNYPNDLMEVLDSLIGCGGVSVVMLYDIIPLLYKQLSDQNHVEAFENWLKITISKSNHIMCISKSVADEITLILRSCLDQKYSIKSVGWSHLGCDFKKNISSSLTHRINSVINSQTPFFLSVGTIEPRKAYSISIDAMEILWARGIEVNFVIVGKYGWSQSRLKERILEHPQYCNRLFWFESASDYQLQCLYMHAHCLISTSLCEGFGLPVIEAAHFGLPAIVSDIPVFREIGGKSTQYFEVTNPKSLSISLISSLNHEKVKADIDIITWTEATKKILHSVKNSNYQYSL